MMNTLLIILFLIGSLFLTQSHRFISDEIYRDNKLIVHLISYITAIIYILVAVLLYNSPLI